MTPAELPHVLKEGALLLTVNRRLARAWQQRYAATQRAVGLTVWETPRILPWSTWLATEWRALVHQGASVPWLLHPPQADALWEEAVGTTGITGRQRGALAEAAQQAWTLLHQQRIPWRALRDTVRGEALSWIAWIEYFLTRCEALGALDEARLPEVFGAHLCLLRSQLPPRVIIAGFDEITPQLTHLFQALAAAGIPIDTLEESTYVGATRCRYEFTDARSEMYAAAHWARTLLESGTLTPDARIGIVVPNLSAQRAALERIFTAVLQPSRMQITTAAKAETLLNFSWGPPLAHAPLIHTALRLLALTPRRLSVEEWGLLLLSPFVAHPEEITARAHLDKHLRRAGERIISAASFTAQAHRHACAILASRLTAWRAQYAAAPRRATASAWAAQFTQILQALGWPGARTLTSAEFQTCAAWRELLVDFGRLDVVASPLTRRAAWTMLQRLAASRAFQPEENANAPLQVMGVLETAGLTFDHLWLMGMHAEAWPRAAAPNPLLPLNLLRRYGVARATAEGEWAFAQRLTTRWANAAPQVIASAPRHIEERVVRISSLMAEWPGATPRLDAPPAVSPCTLEVMRDDVAPSLARAAVAGGAAVLADQAACPFRALATHRLGARRLECPPVGLDDATRGKLLHEVLHAAWEILQTRANAAAALSYGTLATLCHDTAQRVIARAAAARPATFTPRFAALENARLAALAFLQIEHDLTRTDFRVVALEQEQWTQCGDLQLRLRVDRIDELPDGSWAVIDYKTGRPRLSEWFGSRPTAPQLPLYGYALRERVRALLYLRLWPGEAKFLGLSDVAGRAPGVVPVAQSKETATSSWEDLTAQWAQILESLATAYRQGDARVDPKEGALTCRHCDLAPLCRIHTTKNVVSEETSF